MRLRSVLIAAAAAAAAVVPAVGGTASALGTCSVVAPTKVVLDRELVAVPYRLAGDCAVAGAVYASWDVVDRTDGVVGSLTFDGATTTDTWNLYDEMGPGSYAVRPWSALDVDSVVLTQNTPATTVKLGSRLTATATRSAGRLTFDAYARTYSPTLHDWYRRAATNVSVMHLAPGATTWTWVKAAATGSAGRVTLSVVPQPGQYRLMVKETPTVWASWSPTFRGA